MRSYTAKPSEITREWFLIDAKDIPIGRLATRVASILRGKHKPIYTPHMDTGDAIVIINAEKVGATGKKEKTKLYYRHSGKPGALKTTTLEKLRQTHPTDIIELAVKNMLPKGALGRAMFKKLKVYAGENHPHAAQEPKELPPFLNFAK